MSIKSLLETKLREFDPALDLSEGSLLQRSVVTPVIEALSTDPLSVSAREYLYSRFNDLFPQSPISRGNALDDILITPTEFFIDGYREELQRLKNASSIRNIDLLSDDEADALASNWFMSRDVGASATGSVTVTVDRAVPINITTFGTRFYSTSGTEFAPIVDTSITTDMLLGGVVGVGAYRFTLTVRAVLEGADGNIGANTITRVTGIDNVVSVTNASLFSGGLERDSTDYLLGVRLPRAISERSLVTARGIGARLSTAIAGLVRYQVIGFGDAEMLRDKVSAESYGSILGNGYAMYLNNHCVVTALMEGGASVAVGDTLSAISPTLARSTYTVTSVVDVKSGSPVLGAEFSITAVVELETPIPITHSVDYVTILRPNTALLGGMSINSDISLGGRVDVYMKGDGLQDVAGSAILDEDSYLDKGDSWSVAGGVITIVKASPFSGDEFARFDHLILDEYAYAISSIEFNTPEVGKARVTTFDEIDVTVGDVWLVVDMLTYRTGLSARVISPKAGRAMTVSGFIGSQNVLVNGADIVADGVMLGDILEIPSIGVSQPIFEVSGADSFVLEAPLRETVSNVAASITRPTTKLISPIIEISVPEHQARHPLSIDVEAIRSEQSQIASGVGNTVVPLGSALSDAFVTAGCDTVFAEIPDESRKHRGIVTAQEDVAGNTNSSAPLSRGYLENELGKCSLLFGQASDADVETPPRSVNPVGEFRTWCEALADNTNNIFVLRGDAVSSGTELPFPGEGVDRGDILRIGTGVLAGDYIIESVLHNTIWIYDNSVALETYYDSGTQTFEHKGVYTLNDARVAANTTDIATFGGPVGWQRVSLVRIYGEFPKTTISALGEYVHLPVTSRLGSDIGTIAPEFMLDYVNGKAGVFKDAFNDELLEALKTGVADLPFLSACPVTVDAYDITDMLAKLMVGSYTIIRPSRSFGTIRTLTQGGTAVVAKPTTPLLDISDMIPELRNGAVRAVTYKDTENILGSSGTYHVDPTQTNYIGGPDFRDWGSAFIPKIYRDVNINNFALLDAYVTTVAPVEMTGPSAIDHVYMREDAIIHRYVETSVAPHALAVELTETAGQKYVFPAPLFPEWVAGEVDATLLSYLPGQSPVSIPLRYAPQGSGEYTDILSTATGVDGSGTALQTIYADSPAFFYTETPALAEAAVRAFNTIVFPYASADMTTPLDEFRLGSMLPFSGFTLQTPDALGTHVAVAEISERTDMLEIVPTCPIADAPHAVPVSLTPSMYVKVTSGTTEAWRTVTYVDGKKVYLDSPLPFGTPKVRSYGLCIIDLEAGEVLQVADPFSPSGAGALSSEWEEVVTTHMHTGGASRPTDTSDEGMHITLWGFASNDTNYGTLIQDYSREVPDTEQDFLDGLRGPERATFGQFEITSVTQTYHNGFIGQAVAPTKVQIKVAEDLTSAVTTSRLAELSPRYVTCAYVITERSLDVENVGEVLNVAQVTAYAPNVSKYALVGSSKTDAATHLIQPLESAPDYPYISTTEQLAGGGQVTASILSRVVADEPATIETRYVIPVVDGMELRVATTNAQVSVATESMRIDGVGQTGYEISPIDAGLSKSGREDMSIRVPVTSGTISPLLAVTGYFDSAVGQAQALFSSPAERAICSDLLAKTMHSGYIGVTATYVGGPTVVEAEAHLRDVLKAQLAVAGAINRSMITSTIMALGASSVSTPIDLYVCFEDNGRRVHKRTIHDYFNDNTLFGSDVTLRTLYTVLSGTDITLGASISLTRADINFNTLGTGGS